MNLFDFKDESGNNPNPKKYVFCYGGIYELKPKQCSCGQLFTPATEKQEKCEGCMEDLDSGVLTECEREGCTNKFNKVHGKQLYCNDKECIEIRKIAEKKKQVEYNKTYKKKSVPLAKKVVVADSNSCKIIVCRAFEVLEGITDVKEITIKTNSGLVVNISSK